MRALILLTAVILVAGCGSNSNGGDNSSAASTPAAPSGGADTVTIQDFKFGPSTLTVKPGAKVTVTNSDSTTHTATANGGAFDTGDLDPGSSKTITLAKAGTYAYHCQIHPFMKATIVVS